MKIKLPQITHLQLILRTRLFLSVIFCNFVASKNNRVLKSLIGKEQTDMTEQKKPRVLLMLPPLTQLNTPYPSITHLTAYLRSKGFETEQTDLGIELIDALMTRSMIKHIFDTAIQKSDKKPDKNLRIILTNREFYERNIESVMRFLRGQDPTLATRFSNSAFWERMYRMPDEEELEWAYGTSGNTDKAKFLCSLFLKNICDVISGRIDPHFQLIRYGEKICTYLPEFDILERELNKEESLVTKLMLKLFEQKITATEPDVLALSVPFPGNLLAGLQCARFFKRQYPTKRVIMGGGFINTELRQMSDSGIFRYIDYMLFDDGELPLLRLLNGEKPLRTATANGNSVLYDNMTCSENEKFGTLPAPTTNGLRMELYLDFADTANPMHRLWSDGKWNKLMLAHGCYWAKCTFCDTTLDYIARFESCKASVIADRMECMMRETGISGFHFVDEAAPPATLRALAEEILKRGLTVSYWTNIRFDSNFTPELCFLLSRSGCIAVSGGLEVASPRVLKLINKGVTIESARECMKNLSRNNIMVHAYLMYGFPTQTVRELKESLHTVRDMFADNLIQSAFWHRYAMTCHSRSGQHPDAFSAEHITDVSNGFANNEIPFRTKPDVDWDRYSEALNIATYNYMRGTGFDVEFL